MRYYVSKCHDTMNRKVYAPETATPYLCLNPYYKVTLDPRSEVSYILDSGAFQDVRSEHRLTFAQALDRQLSFESSVGRRAEAIVSYDRLVDEQIGDAGLSRVHIFGMGVFRVLVQTDIWARMNGLECSYDTSAPEMNAVYGKAFNPINGEMNKVFEKVHKHQGYVPADLAMFNIRTINHYWDSIEKMPLPSIFIPSIS